MEINNIKATNMELTAAIRDYVLERIGGLQNVLQDFHDLDLDVEVGQTTRGQNKGPIFRAEVNLRLPGTLLRAEETAEDLYEAVDKVKDNLRRQIVDFKERLSDQHKQSRPDKE
jgi:putative sigma-54 modulation protein